MIDTILYLLNHTDMLWQVAITSAAIAMGLFPQESPTHQKRCLDDSSCYELHQMSTGPQRQQGMMRRSGITPGSGMIFIFDDVQYRSFWMKNTLVPLQLYFLDEQKKIVDETILYPCWEVDSTQQSCPLYTSTSPAQYVVEVSVDFLGEISEIY